MLGAAKYQFQFCLLHVVSISFGPATNPSYQPAIFCLKDGIISIYNILFDCISFYDITFERFTP